MRNSADYLAVDNYAEIPLYINMGR
ncbi:protein of unknown function (plasmid) [Cupriavidus taiwanensis]|uniref:Uncharacterized protein n=1 Tax=Cupriavidus taiwanensis TaxID=164546 RepID=A0A7Z7JGK8_9BURK|nr:hypothetical protein CBM2597_U80001 [Cupriavidus taiwanensis]SPC26203.1 hypothetical protein CBM2594_U90001 [Cupriavidus taiwanensis]SPD37864.1 protein of unknown function [Cupriavidus taiwanensis]